MMSQSFELNVGSDQNILYKYRIRNLTVWVTAFILSLAQWRHVIAFYGNDFGRTVQAEAGILSGYPHWRYFQSRLLGPWLEKVLTFLGVNLAIAHIILAIVVFTLTSVAIFYAGRAAGRRQNGWSALLALQVLFDLTMNRPWLFIWDYFILFFGSIFFLLVIRGAPWWSFLILMGMAFLNHESALFIGVWMVAKPLADLASRRRRFDWKMLAGGVLGSAAGLALTEYLRTTFLIKEIGPEIFADTEKGTTNLFGNYFHWQLLTNLNNFYDWITAPGIGLELLIPLTLIVTLILATVLVLRYGLQAAPISLYVAAHVLALLLIGLRVETRDLLQLVPFLCVGAMLAWEAYREQKPGDVRIS